MRFHKRPGAYERSHDSGGSGWSIFVCTMQALNIWQFFAGLTLFLFSMIQIEESLKGLAGRSFKKFLQRQTSSKTKAVAGGAIVTGILQSSSVVLLMVLSFVGAGIISMRNALAVVLGSNIGTTLDSWIVATLGFQVDIAFLSYPFLCLALVGLVFFRKNGKAFLFSKFLIGFSMLFVGLDWMKLSVGALVQHVDFSSWAHSSPFLFVPFGFILTAIIQSSSATMAITLTALYNNVLPIEQAAGIIIGSELGTTVKILLGSIGGRPDKKRVALANFIFNGLTLVVACLILFPLIHAVQALIAGENVLLQLVAFQTSINIIALFLFFPFLGHFASWLDKRFTDEAAHPVTTFIRKTKGSRRDEMLDLSEKETIHLIRKALDLNQSAFGIGGEKSEPQSIIEQIKEWSKSPFSFRDSYDQLKLLQGEILEYLMEIKKEDISQSDIEQIGKYVTICRNVIHAAKNLKDIRHNLQELSDSSNDLLFDIFEEVRDSENSFHKELELLFTVPESERKDTHLEKLADLNKAKHLKSIDRVLALLDQKKVSELEASTLLNVYREVFSSHKAMINAFEDLWDIEQNSEM